MNNTDTLNEISISLGRIEHAANTLAELVGTQPVDAIAGMIANEAERANDLAESVNSGSVESAPSDGPGDDLMDAACSFRYVTAPASVLVQDLLEISCSMSPSKAPGSAKIDSLILKSRLLQQELKKVSETQPAVLRVTSN